MDDGRKCAKKSAMFAAKNREETKENNPPNPSDVNPDGSYVKRKFSREKQTKIVLREHEVGCRVPTGMTQMDKETCKETEDRKETPKEKKRRLSAEDAAAGREFRRLVARTGKPPTKARKEIDDASDISTFDGFPAFLEIPKNHGGPDEENSVVDLATGWESVCQSTCSGLHWMDNGWVQACRF